MQGTLGVALDFVRRGPTSEQHDPTRRQEPHFMGSFSCGFSFVEVRGFSNLLCVASCTEGVPFSKKSYSHVSHMRCKKGSTEAVKEPGGALGYDCSGARISTLFENPPSLELNGDVHLLLPHAMN